MFGNSIEEEEENQGLESQKISCIHEIGSAAALPNRDLTSTSVSVMAMISMEMFLPVGHVYLYCTIALDTSVASTGACVVSSEDKLYALPLSPVRSHDSCCDPGSRVPQALSLPRSLTAWPYFCSFVIS